MSDLSARVAAGMTEIEQLALIEELPDYEAAGAEAFGSALRELLDAVPALSSTFLDRLAERYHLPLFMLTHLVRIPAKHLSVLEAWIEAHIRAETHRGEVLTRGYLKSLAVLYKRGEIVASSAVTAALLEQLDVIEDEVRAWEESVQGRAMSRGAMFPTPEIVQQGLATASTLLACPDLPAEVLVRITQHVAKNPDFWYTEEIIAHPNASIEVWRALAATPHEETRQNVFHLLTRVPEARRDPEIRRAMREAATRWDSVLRPALCLEAGAETPALFEELSRDSPHAAATLLGHPDFSSITWLREEHLLPLLSSESAQIRLAAIAALARFSDPGPLRADPAPQDWRGEVQRVGADLRLPF
jgi:hypothetical protein